MGTYQQVVEFLTESDADHTCKEIALAINSEPHLVSNALVTIAQRGVEGFGKTGSFKHYRYSIGLHPTESKPKKPKYSFQLPENIGRLWIAPNLSK